MRWGLEDESEFAVEVWRCRAGRLEGALSFTCHCALLADSRAVIIHRPGHAWHPPGHVWHRPGHVWHPPGHVWPLVHTG